MLAGWANVVPRQHLFHLLVCRFPFPVVCFAEPFGLGFLMAPVCLGYPTMALSTLLAGIGRGLFGLGFFVLQVGLPYLPLHLLAVGAGCHY